MNLFVLKIVFGGCVRQASGQKAKKISGSRSTVRRASGVRESAGSWVGVRTWSGGCCCCWFVRRAGKLGGWAGPRRNGWRSDARSRPRNYAVFLETLIKVLVWVAVVSVPRI